MNQVTKPSPTPELAAILAFDGNNRLAVRKLGSKLGLAFSGADQGMALQRLESAYPEHSQVTERFQVSAGGRSYRVSLAQVSGTARDSEIETWSLERLEGNKAALAPSLAAMIESLGPELIAIPYLHLSENDFIYKFRPEKERNSQVYAQDEQAKALYQSRLCEVIKRLARQQERSAGKPVELNFGAVSYVIPSHFGFCLGVKNAIERAYETLACNPGKRVFMLSELIHNPFVNEDLNRRGLRYLQTDKGIPLSVEGRKQASPGDPLLWDTLTPDDIVIIPAFGATDEDKRRLIRKGLAVYQHDATCMLVEKVWKAAKSYGEEGFTVIIHGKYEHEETKATFSNTQRHAPALILRNREEAQILAEIVKGCGTAEARELFTRHFAARASEGFDPERHLARIAVVNQTTLLSNETLEIISYLKQVYKEHRGDEALVGGSKKRDTLCYATQVNQDALSLALEASPDAAFVIGGTNSSNTYQLYRLAEARLGNRAFFIQSESAILADGTVEHFNFPCHGPNVKGGGTIERRSIWSSSDTGKRRILLTGGASCPDGIIQQVISRINSLLPAEQLRQVEDVLKDLQED